MRSGERTNVKGREFFQLNPKYLGKNFKMLTKIMLTLKKTVLNFCQLSQLYNLPAEHNLRRPE